MTPKVHMFMPGLRPGSVSWSVYQSFAGALRDTGTDFLLLTDAPPDEEPPDVSGTRFLTVEAPGVRDRLLSPLTRTESFVCHVRALTRHLATAQPDILYMEMVYPLAAAADLAGRIAGWEGRLVVAPMGEDLLVVREASYGFRRFPLPRYLVRRTLRRAAGIRCISPIVQEMTSGLPVPRPVIPLNVADETVAMAERPEGAIHARRAAARSEMRRALGIEGDRVVISLGRLHPFKGIHVLVEAMAGLPEAELVIVGPSLRVRGWGDYGAHLGRLADHLGIADRLHVLGRVPHAEVLDYLAGADALVVPSLRESLNKVCVEAAAAGTPFVVTETTGVSRFLSDEGVGLTIPPGQPEEIRRALRSIFGGSFHRDARASTRFVERFAAARVAPELATLLAQVDQPGTGEPEPQ